MTQFPQPFHRFSRSTMALAARVLMGRASTVVLCALVGIATATAPAGATGSDTFRDALDSWAGVLEQRAQDLDTQPPLPVSRIGAGPTLRRGAVGDRVRLLAEGLHRRGYLSADAVGDVFDDRMDLAVRTFQLDQGLKGDGLVGRATRTELDRTPAEASAMMRQSAAAMRAFRQTAPDTVLIVNLPSQTVTLVRNGRIEVTMRAVVGRPSRETPLLEDRITHVVVNPTWTVPPTVLKQDKMPKLRTTGTPGITNATVYLDGEPVVPETVDWTAVSHRRVRIVQEPGDHNALGRFRFNLTNPMNIYLHGTNEPRLFDRDVRTVSSGCVRLEDARLLAELLLAEVDISPARIDRYMERGEPVWLKVKSLPVRFVYWTATVDAFDTVRLHPDVYDRMDEMSAALAASPAPVDGAPAAPNVEGMPPALPIPAAPVSTAPASTAPASTAPAAPTPGVSPAPALAPAIAPVPARTAAGTDAPMVNAERPL